MTAQNHVDGHHSGGGLVAIRLLARSLDDIRGASGDMQRRLNTAPDTPGLAQTVAPLEAIEKTLRRALEKTWHAHYLSVWTDEIPGLKSGALIAELIAEIGDPYIAEPMRGRRGEDGGWTVEPDGPPRPRTLRQLYAYCGVGDPERKRRRGMTADAAGQAGRPRARGILYLIVDQFVRQRTIPYRDVYDREKAKATAKGWHEQKRRTGPTSGTNRAEQHARRVVAKAFLKDLWRQAAAMQGHTLPPDPWEPMVHTAAGTSSAPASFREPKADPPALGRSARETSRAPTVTADAIAVAALSS